MKALTASMADCTVKTGKPSLSKDEKNVSSGGSIAENSTRMSSWEVKPSPAKSGTEVMYQRWHMSNKHLPEIDQKDIMTENPLFNKGLKPSPEHQMHPEFT